MPIDMTTLITFILVVMTLMVIPGPAVILTITRSLTGGRSIGLATGLGIAVGDIVHTVMATLGLSAILMTSAVAFAAVKYLGVAYLLYLGVRSMLQKNEVAATAPAVAIRPRQAFTQAVLAEILNPKTALFFLAFLPQFVHPEHGSVTLQLLLLGALFVLLSILVTTVFVFVAASLRRLSGRFGLLRRWQGKIVGGVYLGLGAKLALQHRG
ncbi:MAG TPA: LysE family translocator [Terriglobia bacterium]|nr:LysE family translocator [Terriglobia bacterium]